MFRHLCDKRWFVLPLRATRVARDQTSERLFHAHLRVEEQWETVLWEKTTQLVLGILSRHTFKNVAVIKILPS